jgi:hypothetical protein
MIRGIIVRIKSLQSRLAQRLIECSSRCSRELRTQQRKSVSYRPYRPQGSESADLQELCTVDSVLLYRPRQAVIDRRVKARPRYRPFNKSSFCRTFSSLTLAAVDTIDKISDIFCTVFRALLRQSLTTVDTGKPRRPCSRPSKPP